VAVQGTSGLVRQSRGPPTKWTRKGKLTVEHLHHAGVKPVESAGSTSKSCKLTPTVPVPSPSLLTGTLVPSSFTRLPRSLPSASAVRSPGARISADRDIPHITNSTTGESHGHYPAGRDVWQPTKPGPCAGGGSRPRKHVAGAVFTFSAGNHNTQAR